MSVRLFIYIYKYTTKVSILAQGLLTCTHRNESQSSYKVHTSFKEYADFNLIFTLDKRSPILKKEFDRSNSIQLLRFH